MASQFQNRLVGTVIVVALGVIFIPHVLDGKKTREEEEFNTISFAPAHEDQPLLIDLSENNVASHSAGEPLAEPSEEPKQVVDLAPKEKLEAVEFAQPAYVLQLGTFKDAGNVKRLVAKLRGGGYQAHSYPEPAVDGELNRVFVGPDVTKENLESQQAAVQKLTGLAGKVREFDPLFK